MNPQTKQIGVTEAAILKGVRRQTVLHWIRSGRLRAVRVGRAWSIDPYDLEIVYRQRTRNKVAVAVPQYLQDRYETSTQAQGIDTPAQVSSVNLDSLTAA